MSQSLHKKWRCLQLSGIMLVMILSGCSHQETEQIKEIKKTPYQRISYETVTVQRGDIEPILNLTLEPEIVETIDYTVNEEDLELDEILVDVGDQVHKGQQLVTFEAEEIRKSIEKYQNEVEEKRLLLEHYVHLADVERKKDHEFEVAKLADDVELAKLSLQEQVERLQKCSIYAEKDGTISYISKILMDGYVTPTVCMLTEVCGKGNYISETGDDYQFNIGDVYPATNGTTECEMKITDITDTDTATRQIVFEPTSDYIDTSDQSAYTITIQKPILKDIVYVRSIAVQEKDGKEFVYVVTEDGFLEAVYVQTGLEADGQIEIKSGLSGGEEVALK